MKGDEGKRPEGKPVGSVKLAKIQSDQLPLLKEEAPNNIGEASVVKVLDSEVGTEAELDLGSAEEKPAQSAVQVETGKPPVGAAPQHEIDVGGSDFKGSLPLYRFPGSGDAAQDAREASKIKSPSGDRLKPSSGARARPSSGNQPRNGTSGPVSVRRSDWRDAVAERKLFIILILLLGLAAGMFFGIMSHVENSRRDAIERQRLHQLSGKK